MAASETRNELTNEQRVKLFEDLLTGQGAEDFQSFSKNLQRFCPFEAIGMVSQEIRHAHFLSFILDPNRPHPFQDHFLKAFLIEVCSQSELGQFPFRPLDIHFWDCSEASVYRERSNIDLMIEIPGPLSADSKGLVVTIELKVHASESKNQLKTYRKRVSESHHPDEWEHAFVFLTLNSSEPLNDNSGKWIPVSILGLVDRLDLTANSINASGKAVDLYRDYSSMLRRNFVEDENLANIAKRIWTKHRTALEELYNYWPDLQGEIIDWFVMNSDSFVATIHAATGYTLVPDTSGPRLLRFVVEEWKSIDGYCGGDKNWVSSAALIAIELSDWGSGKLRLSLVMGPGNADARSAIYKHVLLRVDKEDIKIGRRTSVLGKWKHFSAEYIQRENDYENGMENEVSAEVLANEAVKKAIKFFKKNLHVYDEILREALYEAGSK